jgi:hypothetical protein
LSVNEELRRFGNVKCSDIFCAVAKEISKQHQDMRSKLSTALAANTAPSLLPMAATSTSPTTDLSFRIG